MDFNREKIVFDQKTISKIRAVESEIKYTISDNTLHIANKENENGTNNE